MLVGSMAVGKTTTGQRLARHLGRPLRDSDNDLERHTATTARELAQRHGVAALHRLEARQLLDGLASKTPSVIAAAASVVEDERCMRALRAPFVVWLRAGPETLLRRIGRGEHRRMLGDDVAGALAALEARRAPRYERLADLVVDVDDLDPEGVARRVLAALPRPWRTAGADAPRGRRRHEPR